jgi:predicted acyl esterase
MRQLFRLGRNRCVTASAMLLVVVLLLAAASSGSDSTNDTASSSARAATAAAATPWPGGTWQPEAATYTMGIESTTLTMDDGVVLHAQIGYPIDQSGQRASGPFPVLVTQNPYPFNTKPEEFFVDRGYLHVVVEIRGTNLSQKSASDPITPIATDLWGPQDGEDGAAVVRWAANPSKLPGSNGVVGLYGCSWLGIVQMQTAAAVGAKSPVKAMIPACTNNGYEVYMPGGIPSDTAANFTAVAGVIGPKNLPANLQVATALRDNIMAGKDQAYDGPRPDGTPGFWQQRDSWRLVQKVVDNRIPALMWTGWPTLEAVTGGVDLYADFQDALKKRGDRGPMPANKPSSGRYQIVVSDGAHGMNLDLGMELEWYDTWLKGEHTGIDKTTTGMHMLELGANRWINNSSWPMTDRYTPFYLSGGTLSTKRPKAATSDSVAFDPSQSGQALTYESDPLATDKTIGGPMAATVYLKSSNRNAHVVLRVYDVAPDGSQVEVTRGNLIASSRRLDPTRSWYDSNKLAINPRGTWSEDIADPGALLVPDKQYRLDVRLLPTLRRVPAGDRLKLVLTTTYPPGDCGGVLGWPAPCNFTAPQQASLTGGVYRIETGGTSASSVNLPLLDPTQLHTARSAVTPSSAGIVQPIEW